MRRSLLLGALLLLGGAQAPKPNVLVILADDLGYSDLGCMGGEIRTPNLDAVAAAGLRFSRFYNTARCWPSRAALLTGYYAQAVRRDTVPGLVSGGRGVRPAWAPLLPVLLSPAAYRSYHSGKWHVDGKPVAAGFDRSYWLEDCGRYFGPKRHFLDDQPLPPGGPGYYATDAVADRAIEFLKEHAEKFADRPFFQYVCFTAPHFPLQAPDEEIAPYRDVYAAGWDRIRAARGRRLKELGLVSVDPAPVERDLGPPYPFPAAYKTLGPGELTTTPEWTSLGEEQRAFQAAKMAVHAAMITRMDRQIGRILDQIRTMKAEENTLVVFVSDNGASAEIMIRDDGHDPAAPPGSAATHLCLGPGWSAAANTPFRRHKTWVHEGGISTPFLVRWPAGIADRGAVRHAPGHLIDLVPTVLELAGLPARTVHGRSLLPSFAKDTPLPREELWWLHEGNRALQSGTWKLVSGKPGENRWELYDLAADRGESKDLAAEQPDRVRDLAARWEARWTAIQAQAARP
jgi:arylsulfatase